MLDRLFSRRPPGPEHDRLFRRVEGIPSHLPAETLGAVWGIAIQSVNSGANAPRDVHFKKLVDWLHAQFPDGMTGQYLRRYQTAYICCYDTYAIFAEELRVWQRDNVFRDLLVRTRHELLSALIEEDQRFQDYQRTNRHPECWATPIDLPGETVLDQVKQMSRDDWHEIALTWNWDHGCEVLAWITAQPDCDLATAVWVLFHTNAGDVAQYWDHGHHDGVAVMSREIVERIGTGFYRRADFSVGEMKRDWVDREIARLHAKGVAPWTSVPADLFDRVSANGKHQPKYTSVDPKIVYAYDYWLQNLAR